MKKYFVSYWDRKLRDFGRILIELRQSPLRDELSLEAAEMLIAQRLGYESIVDRPTLLFWQTGDDMES